MLKRLFILEATGLFWGRGIHIDSYCFRCYWRLWKESWRVTNTSAPGNSHPWTRSLNMLRSFESSESHQSCIFFVKRLAMYLYMLYSYNDIPLVETCPYEFFILWLSICSYFIIHNFSCIFPPRQALRWWCSVQHQRIPGEKQGHPLPGLQASHVLLLRSSHLKHVARGSPGYHNGRTWLGVNSEDCFLFIMCKFWILFPYPLLSVTKLNQLVFLLDRPPSDLSRPGHCSRTRWLPWWRTWPAKNPTTSAASNQMNRSLLSSSTRSVSLIRCEHKADFLLHGLQCWAFCGNSEFVVVQNSWRIYLV